MEKYSWICFLRKNYCQIHSNKWKNILNLTNDWFHRKNPHLIKLSDCVLDSNPATHLSAQPFKYFISENFVPSEIVTHSMYSTKTEFKGKCIKCRQMTNDALFKPCAELILYFIGFIFKQFKLLKQVVLSELNRANNYNISKKKREYIRVLYFIIDKIIILHNNLKIQAE